MDLVRDLIVRVDDTSITRVHLACGENGSAHTESEDILDVERMREALAGLIGTHDFRNFCKMNVKDCHDYTRHINDCSIEQKRVERVTGRFLRETDWVLIIEGSSFLWHMVRCIAWGAFPSRFTSRYARHYRRAS